MGENLGGVRLQQTLSSAISPPWKDLVVICSRVLVLCSLVNKHTDLNPHGLWKQLFSKIFYGRESKYDEITTDIVSNFSLERSCGDLFKGFSPITWKSLLCKCNGKQ